MSHQQENWDEAVTRLRSYFSRTSGNVSFCTGVSGLFIYLDAAESLTSADLAQVPAWCHYVVGVAFNCLHLQVWPNPLYREPSGQGWGSWNFEAPCTIAFAVSKGSL
jgi:hypothetical protein